MNERLSVTRNMQFIIYLPRLSIAFSFVVLNCMYDLSLVLYCHL